MDKDSCFRCGKNAPFQIDSRPTCRRCSVELVEKKIKKTLRNYSLSKDQKILVVGSFGEFVLRKIIQGLPLQINVTDEIPADTHAFDYIITPQTLDDECCAFLNQLLFGEFIPPAQHIIKLFSTISDEDMKTYAHLQDKEFKPLPKPEQAHEALKRLLDFFPHVRNNILKSKQELASCVLKEKLL